MAAVFSLLLFASAPRAQDRPEPQPQLMPTRDVDVTYRLTRPGQKTRTERVRWSVAEQAERIDGPKQSASIFFHKDKVVALLNGASRTYSMLDGAPRLPIEPAQGASLERGTDSVVAGFHCTNWSWTEDGETHTFCMAPDGVLLRHVVDGKTIVEARALSYRQQPPELFEIPPSYAPAVLAPESPAPAR